MKKILIVSFLISITLCNEIISKQKFKREEVNLKAAPLAATGAVILEAARSAAIRWLVEKALGKEYYSMTKGYFRDTYLENGKARFISNSERGIVIAMYWHKDRRHSATCNGGFLGGGQKRAVAPAGHWAIAYCKAEIAGKETYYNNL